LILIAPSFYRNEDGFLRRLRWTPAYSPENFLWYGKVVGRSARLPPSLQFIRDNINLSAADQFQLDSDPDSTHFDEFGELKHMLTTKYSLLNPTRAESTKDELAILLSVGSDSQEPAALAIVLPWLLSASAWRRNIELLDRQLNQLRTTAMLSPSLATFKPIPLLRQSVADLEEALRQMKDAIREEEVQAFAQVQKLAQFRLETIDSVFDTLLKQASALSSKASNEIQLVIGSVTIQVMLSTFHTYDVPSKVAQDSDMMKQQSRRATLLTLLAAFYLPLTLVTGIFGMNIREFDDVKPSFVLCFEALFAVVAVTMIFYGVYRYPRFCLRPLGRLISRLFQPMASFIAVSIVFVSSSIRDSKRRPDIGDLEHGFGKAD
jgi:hypothetical protein